MTSHEQARAFCREVLTAFPGAKITKHPLTRQVAELNGLPPPEPKDTKWPRASTE